MSREQGPALVGQRGPQTDGIFDELPDGLVISERDSGRILRANPAACLMRACLPGQVTGLRLIDLIHLESQAAPRQYRSSMMRERAEAIGALLQLASDPGQGNQLRIRWPKDAEREVE